MDNLRFSSAPTADSIDASIAQHYPDCEPVAVIGYACHFPESPDGETFWQNLLEGRECSRRFTREECNQVNHLIPTRLLVKGGEITCKMLK